MGKIAKEVANFTKPTRWLKGKSYTGAGLACRVLLSLLTQAGSPWRRLVSNPGIAQVRNSDESGRLRNDHWVAQADQGGAQFYSVSKSGEGEHQELVDKIRYICAWNEWWTQTRKLSCILDADHCSSGDIPAWVPASCHNWLQICYLVVGQFNQSLVLEESDGSTDYSRYWHRPRHKQSTVRKLLNKSRQWNPPDYLKSAIIFTK
jgi:hypothetical protein